MAEYKLIQREPTDEMLTAAQDAWLADPARRSSTLFRAMWDAASQVDGVPGVPVAAFDRLVALNESNAARIIELEELNAQLHARLAAAPQPAQAITCCGKFEPQGGHDVCCGEPIPVQPAQAQEDKSACMYTGLCGCKAPCDVAAAHPQPAAQEQEKNAARYKKVRLLNPRLFTAVCRKNISGHVPFDDIIDALEPDLSNFDEVVGDAARELTNEGAQL